MTQCQVRWERCPQPGGAGLGKHLIAEFWACDPRALNDPTYLHQTLQQAAQKSRLHVIRILMHAFSPHGVTGVALLSESHLSIHTWPEYGYAAVDVFTCGGEPERALAWMKARLHARRVEVRALDRGCPG